MTIPWWVWLIAGLVVFNVLWRLQLRDMWRRRTCTWLETFHDTDRRNYTELPDQWQDRGLCRRCGQRIIYDTANWKEHVAEPDP